VHDRTQTIENRHSNFGPPKSAWGMFGLVRSMWSFEAAYTHKRVVPHSVEL
jgi:hypothetical protein